jgi:hypothetical protein
MNKPYLKPEIEKKLVPVQVLRMIDKNGFIDVFWEELALQRKLNPCISHESVFDELNKRYFDILGYFRYSSYDSFRQRINE